LFKAWPALHLPTGMESMLNLPPRLPRTPELKPRALQKVVAPWLLSQK
jgi:hypothetical protein